MDFEYRIGHMRVENPIGCAGGVARSPEDIEKLGNTGVGWGEVGSYSLDERTFYDAQSQNPWHYDEKSRIASNAYRMQNPGMRKLEKEIMPRILETARTFGKQIIGNFTVVSDNPVEEAVEGIERMWATGVDGVLLNPACPSLKKTDIPLSYDFEKIIEIKQALRPITEKYHPIFIRPAPSVSACQMRKLVTALSSPIDSPEHSLVFSALFATNTWSLDDDERKRIGFQPGMGGKSGGGMWREARTQTVRAVTSNKNNGRTHIDVVSSIGIDNGAEAAVRIHTLGATACAVSSPLMRDTSWGELVDKFNRDYLDKADQLNRLYDSYLRAI